MNISPFNFTFRLGAGILRIFTSLQTSVESRLFRETFYKTSKMDKFMPSGICIKRIQQTHAHAFLQVGQTEYKCNKVLRQTSYYRGYNSCDLECIINLD